MDEGEKRIKQEDCSEDKLGAGILTLTNKRLAFDKTRCKNDGFFKTFWEIHIRYFIRKCNKNMERRIVNEKSMFYCKNR